MSTAARHELVPTPTCRSSPRSCCKLGMCSLPAALVTHSLAPRFSCPFSSVSGNKSRAKTGILSAGCDCSLLHHVVFVNQEKMPEIPEVFLFDGR